MRATACILLLSITAPSLAETSAVAGGAFVAPMDDDDAGFFTSILRGDGSTLEMRTQAAARLLKLDDAKAVTAIDDALRSGHETTVMATLQAMATATAPSPALLDATMEALETAPPQAWDLLAVVLSTFEDRALQRLITVAEDRAAPEDARLAAINAMSSFPEQASGDRLIVLADPDRGEVPAVREAAMVNFRRLAPVDLGDEYESWSAWWTEAREKTREQWSRDLVQQYQKRTAQLERSNIELSSRYIGALREMFRSLPGPDDQLERLPRYMGDSMPRVRGFALDRVSLLIRDGVLIPESLRSELAKRLNDETPALRLRAMRLLSELDEPNLGRLLVARVKTETNRTVLEGLLPMLVDHPQIDALEHAMRWLSDSQLGPIAADAVWSIVRHPVDEHRQTVAPPVDLVRTIGRNTLEGLANRDTSPALARLWAFVADDPNLPGVVTLLDSTDPALRGAVADGLGARGRFEPLLERLADDAIYAAALRALAEGTADLPRFELLLEARRARNGNGNDEPWAHAVRTLASRLDPAVLLSADDMLARVENGRNDVRALVLTRAALLPTESLAPTMRGELLIRLTPMLIEQGDALRALEVIENAQEHAQHPDLAAMKFRCAVLAGQYDVAATIRDEPIDWVQLFIDLVQRDPKAAVSVRDAIRDRYGDILAGEVREHFEAAARELPATSSSETHGRADAGSSVATP